LFCSTSTLGAAFAIATQFHVPIRAQLFTGNSQFMVHRQKYSTPKPV